MTTKDTSRYRVGPDSTIKNVDLDSAEVHLPDGRRLTEELAEELAEDTIRRGVGRPALSASGDRARSIGVRLPPELDRRVRERASAEGKRPSEIVREALEAYV